MDNKEFAYFLTVQDIEPTNISKLLQMMRQDRFFSGLLSPTYSADDAKQNRVYFDCGDFGCISEIRQDDVEKAMHTLATTFPKSRFHLLAENVDDRSEQYQICTFGDMYQYAQRQSYMPELSRPVPFDQRAVTQTLLGEKDYLNEFLHKTDFNLLYEQKTALLKALNNPSSLSEDTIEGLANFLDFIGDWAESEGLFVSPAYEKEDLLDSMTQFIKQELGDSGKISYPLPDGKSFVQISVEYGGDECMNPGKEFYELKLYHPKGNGFVSNFSSYANFNDTAELREACQHCLDHYERYQQSEKKQPLDKIISSAANRAGDSATSGKSKDLEK